MKQFKMLFVLALVAFMSAPAFAETQNVKISGSLDAYAFMRRNFDLTDNNDASVVPVGVAVPGQSHAGSTAQRSEADNYFMSITQVQIAADLTDNVSTVIDLINQRDWNAQPLDSSGVPSASNQAANEFDIELNLAYVQMKEIFYSPLTLTVGRQNLVFGRGMIVGWNPQNYQNLIGATEFTQEQSFDAIRATLDFNPWTLDFVYSKIAEGANNVEDDSDLYIANVNYKFAEYNAVAEAYYMGIVDRRTLSGATGTFNNETDTVGGRVQFDPISQMTLGGELAYQFGQYRALVTSPTRDRDAWFADVFGEYRFDNAWKPMLGIQYDYESGENDLGSGSTSSYGSWNAAYRSPTFGWIHDYLEVYYATAQTNDQAAQQNQQFVSVYGSINPMSDLKLSANYYHFWTATSAHVVMTNPNSGSLSSDIGDELDTTISYSYTEDVTFNFMANWFFPGSMYSSPNDATASEFISEVKVTF